MYKMEHVKRVDRDTVKPGQLYETLGGEFLCLRSAYGSDDVIVGTGTYFVPPDPDKYEVVWLVEIVFDE